MDQLRPKIVSIKRLIHKDMHPIFPVLYYYSFFLNIFDIRKQEAADCGHNYINHS